MAFSVMMGYVWCILGILRPPSNLRIIGNMEAAMVYPM